MFWFLLFSSELHLSLFFFFFFFLFWRLSLISRELAVCNNTLGTALTWFPVHCLYMRV